MILLAGIYIHIPFCKQACHYCDFHFNTSQKSKRTLLEALKTELIMRQNYLSDESISTIYFGGGTPSLLTPGEVDGILSTIFKFYRVARPLEITLEANPDDLTNDYLKELYKVGVNRLSIGVQSFHESVLRWMNRAHDSKQALKSVEISRSAGFDNISIDLIYGIPLSDHNLESDLLKAVALQPDHISAYNLTIEPGTVFGHRLKKGALQEISEENAAECFELTMTILRANGYIHYEISNFAIPGKESHHNTGYWDGHLYLGIGPSAHSFNGSSRQYNIASNGRYLQSINAGVIPSTLEELTPGQKINELIMLGLRNWRGVDLQMMNDNFGWDLVAQNRKYLEELTNNGFAQIKKNKLLLTDKGKLVADRIAGDLFIKD